MEKLKQAIEREIKKLAAEDSIKIELKMELVITRSQDERCDRVPSQAYEDGECDGAGPRGAV